MVVCPQYMDSKKRLLILIQNILEPGRMSFHKHMKKYSEIR